MGTVPVLVVVSLRAQRAYIIHDSLRTCQRSLYALLLSTLYTPPLNVLTNTVAILYSRYRSLTLSAHMVGLVNAVGLRSCLSLPLK